MDNIETNMMILDYIKKCIFENPNLRFTQILFHLNINRKGAGGDPARMDDNFYDANYQVIDRIKKTNP